MPKSITIKGITYNDQAPEVALHIEELTATIETIKKDSVTALAAVQTKLDAMTAERDVTKTKLDAAQVEIAALPGKVVSAGKTRAELVAVATPHLDKADVEKIDTLTDAQIKKAVSVKAFPTSKDKILAIKDDNAEGLAVWFDAAMAAVKNDATDAAARSNREAAHSRNDTTTHVDGCQCDACTSKGKNDINEEWKKNKKDAYTQSREKGI